MKKLVAAALAALFIVPAFASSDPVADTRQILAGTVTTKSVKQSYLSGAKDGTAAFQGALAAYKAVRAAEMPMPPMPAPVVAYPVASPNGLAGEIDIADNFDTSSILIPGEAPTVNVDDVGAFRFTCLPGGLAKDDPIVYPGQPGKSHLHQFWGNTATNAGSTYQSLRTSGGSTCTRSTGTSVQRSAYWMPAMLDGAGNAVKADWINTYYKRLPASDPNCALTVDPTTGAPGPSIGKCVELPNGIRMITGFNMAAMSGGPNDTNSRDYWALGFECTTATTDTGIKHNLADVAASDQCPVGADLRVALEFPTCWDGRNLDTADHRKQMVYPPQSVCPADHPYVIPTIAASVHFTTDANFKLGLWHLSSDEMLPGFVPGFSSPVKAGTSLHADYWEAWSPTIKHIWNVHCIDQHLTCSTGNVGTGQMISGMQQLGPTPSHVLVPLSSIP